MIGISPPLFSTRASSGATGLPVRRPWHSAWQCPMPRHQLRAPSAMVMPSGGSASLQQRPVISHRDRVLRPPTRLKGGARSLDSPDHCCLP